MATYLDSSAIVKLVVRETESTALRRYLRSRRRRPLISSALARTEVLRAVLPAGERVADRALSVLGYFDLFRLNDRILKAAGLLQPNEVRSLDAIHLATALALGDELKGLVTYDDRMATAADELGLRVTSPS